MFYVSEVRRIMVKKVNSNDANLAQIHRKSEDRLSQCVCQALGQVDPPVTPKEVNPFRLALIAACVWFQSDLDLILCRSYDVAGFVTLADFHQIFSEIATFCQIFSFKK